MKIILFVLAAIACGVQGMEKALSDPALPSQKNAKDLSMQKLIKIEELFAQNPRAARKELKKLKKSASFDATTKSIAVFQLAQCYQNGTGGKKDIDKAKKFYQELGEDNPHLASEAIIELVRLTTGSASMSSEHNS